jgi:peptidoglycan/xylan/chitin deacetylase (PgdA/CDA1 family)
MPHLHKLAAVAIVVAVAVGLLAPPASGRHHTHARPVAARTLRPAAVRHPRSVAPPPFDRARAAAAARAAGADELGDVPVLMIHRVLAKPSTTLDRTPAQLYAEFTRLARENYVPVTAAEFVTGQMNVPAGRHPVVLTFDDGSDSQFALDAGGNPRPDTAVGIIERVAREHPGFRPTATFFVNEEPFGSGASAMRWLAQHGFEVANHTTHHRDLAGMSKHEIAKEIGTDQQAIAGATGRPPVTFAYPFGVPPHLEWVARGSGWKFLGMFLAAWKPADSPFGKDFDPRQIPRIRDDGKIKQDDCKLFCSTAWLDWLARNPDKRYTSDGNPATVAFPRAKMIELGKRFKAQACPY